jgi:hypothetical protein
MVARRLIPSPGPNQPGATSPRHDPIVACRTSTIRPERTLEILAPRAGCDHSINSRWIQGLVSARKTYLFPPKTLEVLDLQAFQRFPT